MTEETKDATVTIDDVETKIKDLPATIQKLIFAHQKFLNDTRDAELELLKCQRAAQSVADQATNDIRALRKTANATDDEVTATEIETVVDAEIGTDDPSLAALSK